MILGGAPERVGREVAQRAGDAVEKGELFFLALWERLEEGDPATWIAFIIVSAVALAALGLWRGSITIGRR